MAQALGKLQLSYQSETISIRRGESSQRDRREGGGVLGSPYIDQPILALFFFLFLSLFRI